MSISAHDLIMATLQLFSRRIKTTLNRSSCCVFVRRGKSTENVDSYNKINKILIPGASDVLRCGVVGLGKVWRLLADVWRRPLKPHAHLPRRLPHVHRRQHQVPYLQHTGTWKWNWRRSLNMWADLSSVLNTSLSSQSSWVRSLVLLTKICKYEY